MELCFRTALCLFVLIGCFQAVPLGNFRFRSLQGITCHGNVTFKSPKRASESCLTAAFDTIREEMQKAITSCETTKHSKRHCEQSLEALEHAKVFTQDNNSSDCKRETEGALTFQDFLKEYKEVIENINSNIKP